MDRSPDLQVRRVSNLRIRPSGFRRHRLSNTPPSPAEEEQRDLQDEHAIAFAESRVGSSQLRARSGHQQCSKDCTPDLIELLLCLTTSTLPGCRPHQYEPDLASFAPCSMAVDMEPGRKSEGDRTQVEIYPDVNDGEHTSRCTRRRITCSSIRAITPGNGISHIPHRPVGSRMEIFPAGEREHSVVLTKQSHTVRKLQLCSAGSRKHLAYEDICLLTLLCSRKMFCASDLPVP
jgi:hypothetical protein